MPEGDAHALKTRLRRDARARREALAPAWCAKAEAAIRERVRSFLEARGVQTVATYAAMRGEPEPISEEGAGGIRVCWPVSDPKTRSMRFRAAQGALQPQPPWNIPEPVDGPWVEAREIDAILLPGLLFSPDGVRLGYGGGFYDRYLSCLQKDALRIGICYAWQIVEVLPREPHDHNVEFIITEAYLRATAHAVSSG